MYVCFVIKLHSVQIFINAVNRHASILMPLMHAYFYSPHESDHFINHVVTSFDPPYSHCDVQFEDGMASSVFQGEKLYWRRRTFRKPGYSRITVAVEAEGYQRAYRMCHERFAQEYSFDAIGMLALPLGASLVALMERPGRTFCSRHCAEVLQAAGVRSMRNVDVKTMTPSMLQRALQENAVIHTDRIDLRIDTTTSR